MELRETATLDGEKLYPDKFDAIQEQASLHTGWHQGKYFWF